MMPLLETLRYAAPRARITLVAGDRFSSILEGDPRVDEILNPEDGMRTLAALRRVSWDLALSTPFPGATSFSGSLLLAWSHARRRIGYDHPRSRSALTHSLPLPDEGLHAVRELLDLSLLIRGCLPILKSPSLNLSVGEGPLMRSMDERIRQRAGHRRFLIHTGGRGLKGWSLPAFQELGKGLASSGFDLWVAQGPDAPAWPESGDRSYFTLPPMPIKEFGQTLAKVDRFIGCDSGVMHLSAAVGTPVTAIFRSSDPRRYAPIGADHQILILGSNSARHLDRGTWPSLPKELSPRLDQPSETLLNSEPEAQVAWALEKILDAVLETGSRPRHTEGAVR